MRVQVTWPFALALTGVLGLALMSKGEAAPGGNVQCDPNESCNRCLIHNPFGGCIQYGNDPVCEARKKACQIVSNPDPVKILVNPLSYINTTGIPTPGDFMELVIKDPDQAIELIRDPGQWPYIPVANAIIAGRNAVIAGGPQQIPQHLRPFLRRWYPDDLINSVRWTSNWGPLQNTLQAAQMHFNSSTQAIALINAVVFRDAQAAQDGPLWAHELFHVQQYRTWGVFGFARQWVNNSSTGGPVEAPAYAREAEARSMIQGRGPGPGSGPGPGRGPMPPPGLARGTVITQCGCWGFVQPGAVRQAPQCSSRLAGPEPCAGYCPAGGSPWGEVCR